MASGAEVCTGIIVLVIIAFAIIIFFKILKYMAYLGQYRTGKAMKKISREGLTINQGYPPQGYYQQPPQQYAYPQPQQPAPPRTDLYRCPRCNTLVQRSDASCPYCRTPLQWGPAVQAYSQQPAAEIICPHCGAPVMPGKPYCSMCGTKL